MEYAEFRREVADRTDLAEADVETAVGATLVTLSERVPDEAARGLAEQLPGEVGGHLTAADGHESFGYDEFVARVAERTGAGDPDLELAEYHAQAVVSVLLDAVQSETSDDVLSHLTADYEDLFGMVDPEDVWGPGWRDRLGEAG